MDDIGIVYGTQTGDSEELGFRMYSQLEQTLHFHLGLCTELDSIPFNSFIQIWKTHCNVMLFFVSTTGDAYAPSTMKSFWIQIRKKSLKSDELKGLKFVLFGLGHSSYPKFNAVGKRLEKRLIQLGAQSVIPSVFSDDAKSNGGHDFYFSQFYENLLEYLESQRELHSNSNYFKPSLQSPSPQVIIHQSSPINQLLNQSNISTLSPNQSNNFRSSLNQSKLFSSNWRTNQAVRIGSKKLALLEFEVVRNDRITSESMTDREVRHITLKIRNFQSTFYRPGDVLYVMPRNETVLVNAFLTMMRLNEPEYDIDEENLYIEKPRVNISQPCSIRQLVECHFDINAIPKRQFIQKLCEMCPNALEKSRLEYFLGSEEGESDLIQYTIREKRSILLVFRDFPSIRPSLSQLIQIMPRIRPRAFSIASSNRTSSENVELCVSVVKYSAILNTIRHGLCSNYLSHLYAGSIVPGWIDRGSIEFPNLEKLKEKVSLVLICTGTGIAPMRAFLNELEMSFAKKSVEIYMYFGCRHEKDGDFLYENELKKYVSRGMIKGLRVAFSRDQIEHEKKIYVQDLLEEDKDIMKPILLDGKTQIYITGSSGAMPRQVQNTLEFIAFGTNASQSDENALHAFQKRIHTECW